MNNKQEEWKLKTFPCMWTAWDKEKKMYRECHGKPVKIINGYTACNSHYRRFFAEQRRKNNG